MEAILLNNFANKNNYYYIVMHRHLILLIMIRKYFYANDLSRNCTWVPEFMAPVIHFCTLKLVRDGVVLFNDGIFLAKKFINLGWNTERCLYELRDT